MIANYLGFNALRGLVLAGCLAMLAACSGHGSSSNETADAAMAAPAGLTASTGNAEVTLKWTVDGAATGYHVKRSTTSGGPYTAVGTTTAAAYTDATVTNGTTYYYVVSALDAAGESADSAQIGASPVAPTEVPAAATDLRATPGNAQASLTWTASSGATSYDVKRSTISGGPYTQLASTTSPSYTDASVTNGVTYFYVVMALNDSGTSPASTEVSVTPDPAVTTPAVPTGFTATAGNAQVRLAWTASSGAASYHLKRSTTSGGPYTQVGAPTSPAYTDTVSNGTKYYYVVSALDSAGESANSAQVSAAPTAPVATPPVPAGLTATAGNAQASLTWTASSGATSYHLKRATTSGGTYTQVAAPTAAAYTDTGLTNGTTYYYVVSALDSAGESANSAQVSAAPVAPTSAPTANNCGMQLGGAVTFCETFDAPAGTGNRSGDLNGNVWGVSREIQDGVNFGQHEYDQWNATVIQKCDGTTPTVNAPNDVIICNGQLREATNDNNPMILDFGTVTSLAMYPKQPFDFAGRTGTVSFDVSNDTGGIHSAWPEFWMSDLPVPVPFNHFDAWLSLPANGFGIRFALEAPIGVNNECPNNNNLDKVRFTVDSAAVVRGYVLDDTNGYGRTNMTVTPLDCVIESSGPGDMNHIELRISQNQIDVYATDAGVAATPTTLRHIAVISNANLTLTRGLVWFEDVHYNADKGLDPARTSQRQHTFSWDNVAFDGPFVYRDFSYDAPDNTDPGANGSINLGKLAAANQTSTWNVPGIPANPTCSAVRVLFNFNEELNPNPTTLTVIVNGHTHTVPWPYPDQLEYTWRSFAVTIPVTDLVAGTNVVQLGADVAEIFANVDLVLVDVSGGVPVLPGANDAYPGP